MIKKRCLIRCIYISIIASTLLSACRPLSGVYRSDYNLAIFADSSYLTSAYMLHKGTFAFSFGKWEVEEDTLILNDYYVNHPIQLYVSEVEDSSSNDTVIYRNDKSNWNFPNYVFFKKGEKYETRWNAGVEEPTGLIGCDSFYIVFGSINHENWPNFRTTMYYPKNPNANQYFLWLPNKPNWNIYSDMGRRYIIGRNKLMLHSNPSGEYGTMHRCKRKARMIRVY